MRGAGWVAGKDGSHKVRKLLRSELVALEIAHQPAVPANNGGMQGVVHQTLIRKIIFSKQSAHSPNLSLGAGQEMPTAGLCVPFLRIFLQRIGRIMDGIESDGNEHHISAERVVKALLKRAEVI